MKNSSKVKYEKSFLFYLEPSLYNEFKEVLAEVEPDISIGGGIRKIMRDFVKRQKDAKRKSFARNLTL